MKVKFPDAFFLDESAQSALKEGLDLMWSLQPWEQASIYIRSQLPIWFCGLRDFVASQEWDHKLVFAGARLEIDVGKTLRVMELVRLSEKSDELKFYGLTEGPLVEATGHLLRSTNAQALVRLPGVGRSFLRLASDGMSRLMPISPVAGTPQPEPLTFLQVHKELRSAALRALKNDAEDNGPETLYK